MALVGYGSVAQKHLKAIEALGQRVELVAIADTDAAARQAARARFDVPCFERLEALLAASDAQLVILTTPSGLHPEQARTIAQAGRHILTEKPLALRAQDALMMQRAADDAGVGLFVIQQLRLLPMLQTLQRAIEQGALGQLYTSAVQVFWNRDDAYFQAAPWRGTSALDGGVLLNQANHYLDLLIWMFGAPQSVMAELATLGRQIQAPDTATVLLRWPSHMVSFHASVLAWPNNLEATFTVLGSQGSVKLQGAALEQVHTWRMAQDPIKSPEALQALIAEDLQVRAAGHTRALEEVLDRLACGQHQDHARFAQLLNVLYTVEAIERSAKTGRRVTLDEITTREGDVHVD